MPLSFRRSNPATASDSIDVKKANPLGKSKNGQDKKAKSFKCEERDCSGKRCGKDFESKAALQAHLKKYHSNEKDQAMNKYPCLSNCNLCNGKCNYCNRNFMSRQKQSKVDLKEMEKNWFTCPECDARATGKSSMKLKLSSKNLNTEFESSPHLRLEKSLANLRLEKSSANLRLEKSSAKLRLEKVPIQTN